MFDNEKLMKIIELGTELNTVQDVDILLEKILRETRKLVNADAGTIYIKKENHLSFSHAQNDTLQGKLPPGEKLIYSSFSVPLNLKSIAGYVAKTGEILNINDVYTINDSSPYHFDPGYDRQASYRTKSMLTAPLKTDRGELLGVLQIINKLDDGGGVIEFNNDDERFIHYFASTASMVLQKANMTRALLLRMIQMAELRDPKETGAHVNRVASISVEIYERWAVNNGLARGIIDDNRDILRMAAMLHDVGKVSVSDLILKKPAKFTPEEYEIMKMHTVNGAKLFGEKHSRFDEIASDVALNHHENWDGTGYPGRIDTNTWLPVIDTDGRQQTKSGEDISIFGRVVALADVYDALSSKRVYKDPWEQDMVLEELKKLSGKKFDPQVVDAFFGSFDIIRSVFARYPEGE